MTRWEFFESGLGLIAAKLGVIPIDLLVKYDCYKTYKDFLSKGHTVAESKVLASDKCRYHYASIARAIYWFEEPEVSFEVDPFIVRSFRKGPFLRKHEKSA
jgi:hypothetical protein